MKKRNISTGGSAGKKAAGPERSKRSFTLKERCRLLTVRDYIELVCEDNFDVLTVEGTPTRDAQNEAKMAVLSEFAELSGSDSFAAAQDTMRSILKYRAEILGISIALSAIDVDYAGATKVLGGLGVDTGRWDADNLEPALKRVQALLKAKSARLNQEIRQYNGMATRSNGRKTTEADIRGEMSVIGKYLGHGITDDCNLATYAAHKKNYMSYIKSLENEKYRTRSAK